MPTSTIDGKFGSNIVGWASQPLGLIPATGTPLQIAVDKGMGQIVEATAKRPYNWFYLISKFGSPKGMNRRLSNE